MVERKVKAIGQTARVVTCTQLHCSSGSMQAFFFEIPFVQDNN